MNTKPSTTTYTQQTPESIRDMFGSIAHRYDKANAVMSFNMHKTWNSQLVKEVTGHQPHTRVLDLCCGTGDIIFELLKRQSTPCEAHGVDFCAEMLDWARIKSKSIPEVQRHHITFVEGDAQAIPLPDDYVDCVTVAYGIRNVKEPARCIQDTYRVLRKGGIFGILELTTPENRIMRFGHQMYLKNILPLIGKLVSDNRMAYEYLCNSIHTFIPPDSLVEMLRKANFSEIKKVPLLGGVATIITARK